MCIKKSIFSVIDRELLFEAIEIYKLDLIDEAPEEDEGFKVYKEMYVKNLLKIHKKIKKNEDIPCNLIKDKLEDLISVLKYYIPIREEAIECGGDDPQIHRSQKILPILHAVRNKLAELNRD